MTTDPATCAPPAAPTGPGHRRNGKIAKLPKELRELINHLLDDGATYSAIIRQLAEHDVSLNHENVSNWHEGGYQDYLRLNEWRAELHSLRESASSLSELNDARQFQHTLIQLALTDIFRVLSARQLQIDSPNYLRLFHALARLNREALALRKYDDLCDHQKARELKRLDPNRDLEKERDLMIAALERALGFPAAPGPIGPDTNQWPPAPAVENQNSKIENPITPLESGISNSPSVPDPAAGTAEASAAPPAIENQNSKIENPMTPLESGILNLQSLPEPAGNTPEPAVAAPAIENQNSKIENPQELCYECRVPLPPLRPDGRRPQRTCRACGFTLYPPGTPFQYCQFCDTANPRPPEPHPSSDCRRCGCALPPLGRRFLDRCPKCGLKLRNVTNLGTRLSDRCPDCRAELPLLEPNAPPDPAPDSSAVLSAA